jgi:hypothetical protein
LALNDSCKGPVMSAGPFRFKDIMIEKEECRDAAR